MKVPNKILLAAAGAACALTAAPPAARACGGFFCNTAQPVNQAAEQIIFADNGDDTVTAVIQIMYQGPSQSFSWLLPISGVPKVGDVGVGSNLAFQRLQSFSNPQYTLTTSVEGTCRQDTTNSGVSRGGSAGAAAGTGGSTAVGGPTLNDGGVTVEATVTAGAFEGVVISFDASLDDPADAAKKWLTDNGYDVPASAPDLLRPYLEDNLNLLALKLQKGADTGSIRPIVLTYPASKPMIPIKLTAVAANDDMGVLVWLLSDARAVPQNYYSLDLNEALINWFNPAPTYGAVVSAAADDAGGKGFVTEFAGPTTTYANVAWTTYDQQSWQSFKGGVYQSFNDIFNAAYSRWQGYDGFWDAVQATVTLPDGVSFADFKLCPSCYGTLDFKPSAFIDALDKNVMQPMQAVQNIIDAHPEITRLYTTMSADEMTVDPLFTFNHDQPDVSNVHQGKRVIECSSKYYQSEAPWRIELPQGGVIRGVGQPSQTWPFGLDSSMPANYRITQQGDTGDGNLIEDNSKKVDAALKTYNDSVPAPVPSSGGTSSVGGSGGTNPTSGVGGTDTGAVGGAGAMGGEGGVLSSMHANASGNGHDSGSCALSPGQSTSGWAWLLAMGLAMLGRRRRRS
ncbi:MAG TPA: DUF2330 domain-containing protein [Polyangiaceae bacterium]|nr:DUF2330 domain-containing protein [Polyangiaceae bacterium]